MFRPASDAAERLKAQAPMLRLVWDGRIEPQAIEPPRLVRTSGEADAHGPPDGWDNRLILGDNLLVMAALERGELAPRIQQAGGFHLIYIDPPYAMETDFHIDAAGAKKRGRGAQGKKRITANGTLIDAKPTLAFRDSWGGGPAYLQFMYERLVPMRRLLADDGVLCVHCDWRASAWLRVLLDEVFGRECFRNEVVWRRAPNLGNQAAAKQLGRVVDSILVYSKNPGSTFRGTPPMRSDSVPLTPTGRPRGSKWDEERKEWFTTAPRGDYTDASIAALRREGRVYDTPSGKVYIKYPLRRGEPAKGEDAKLWYKDQPVDTLWTDDAVKPLRHCTRAELDIGYPTQKPLGLLRRVVEWTTREGDLVGDFFCGSGTTLAAAAGLRRKWIGCDVGETAVRIAAERLPGCEQMRVDAEGLSLAPAPT